MPLRRSSLDQRRDGVDLVGPVAGVEAHRGARIDLIGAADGVRDEGLEQRRRNVVDAVKIDVLEQMQGHALAGAGQAADDERRMQEASALTPQDEERALMTSSA